MVDYEEVLYYSAKQAGLSNDCGVVLVDGQNTPVFWSETVSNTRMRDFNMGGMRAPEPRSLKSNWDDAICIFQGKGDGTGYKRLLDGRGQVTQDGMKWCALQGIDPTPKALMAAAQPPSTPRIRIMKPLHLRGK